MKKYCFIFFCLFSLNTLAQATSAGWELWYPYQYRDKAQQLVGLDFSLVNAIFKQSGFKAEYRELPWARHLNYLKSGAIDIAMGASFSDERKEYAYFTEPYRKERINLCVKKGQAKHLKLRTLESLITSKYIIGVERSYFYGKKYQQLMNNVKFRQHINEVIDVEQNVGMLFKGHIDGFFVDPATIKTFAEKHNMVGEFELHPLVLYQSDIHIMLSKKSTNPEMLNRLNDAIRHLKSNGEIDKIIASWSQIK
jgi:polar amino acid transport system substrate-binding protein